jgi:hypothetical protein
MRGWQGRWIAMWKRRGRGREPGQGRGPAGGMAVGGVGQYDRLAIVHAALRGGGCSIWGGVDGGQGGHASSMHGEGWAAHTGHNRGYVHTRAHLAIPRGLLPAGLPRDGVVIVVSPGVLIQHGRPLAPPLPPAAIRWRLRE